MEGYNQAALITTFSLVLMMYGKNPSPGVTVYLWTITSGFSACCVTKFLFFKFLEKWRELLFEGSLKFQIPTNVLSYPPNKN